MIEAWASMAVADYAEIWFLTRSVASAAKYASSLLLIPIEGMLEENISQFPSVNFEVVR